MKTRSFRNLFNIIGNFLKLTFNKKKNFVLFFLLPVVGFVVMFLLFGFSHSRPLVIGHADLDTGRLSGELITYLKRSRNMQFAELPLAELNKQIIDGKINLALTIPAGFTAGILAGNPVDIRLAALKEDGTAAWLENSMNQFINYTRQLNLAAGATGEEASVLDGGYLLHTRELVDTTTRNQGSQIGIGIMLFLILMQASLITRLMLVEKQQCTFYRIKTAPVKEIVYTLGNMLAAFIIIAAQISLTLVVVSLLKIPLGLPLWQILIILLAFSLAAIGLGVMITALAGSMVQASFLVNLIIAPTCMLGGCFWPREFMSVSMQQFSRIFPQSWAIDAVVQLQNGASFASIGFILLLLVGYSGLFTCIYAFKMRYTKQVLNFV